MCCLLENALRDNNQPKVELVKEKLDYRTDAAEAPANSMGSCRSVFALLRCPIVIGFYSHITQTLKIGNPQEGSQL